MGNLLGSLWSAFFGPYRFKICMVGLDNAGKTTLLYRMALGEVVQTQPTIGANVETVQHENIEFTVWDIGGQQALRDIWTNYLSSANHVILVVDSTDTARFPVVKYELAKLLRMECLQNAAMLIFANKQDVPGAVTPAQLAVELGLTDVRDRKYHVQECSVIEGRGIEEGLKWLADTCVNPGQKGN